MNHIREKFAKTFKNNLLLNFILTAAFCFFPFSGSAFATEKVFSRLFPILTKKIRPRAFHQRPLFRNCAKSGFSYCTTGEFQKNLKTSLYHLNEFHPHFMTKNLPSVSYKLPLSPELHDQGTFFWEQMHQNLAMLDQGKKPVLLATSETGTQGEVGQTVMEYILQTGSDRIKLVSAKIPYSRTSTTELYGKSLNGTEFQDEKDEDIGRERALSMLQKEYQKLVNSQQHGRKVAVINTVFTNNKSGHGWIGVKAEGQHPLLPPELYLFHVKSLASDSVLQNVQFGAASINILASVVNGEDLDSLLTSFRKETDSGEFVVDVLTDGRTENDARLSEKLLEYGLTDYILHRKNGMVMSGANLEPHLQDALKEQLSERLGMTDSAPREFSHEFVIQTARGIDRSWVIDRITSEFSPVRKPGRVEFDFENALSSLSGNYKKAAMINFNFGFKMGVSVVGSVAGGFGPSGHTMRLPFKGSTDFANYSSFERVKQTLPGVSEESREEILDKILDHNYEHIFVPENQDFLRKAAFVLISDDSPQESFSDWAGIKTELKNSLKPFRKMKIHYSCQEGIPVERARALQTLALNMVYVQKVMDQGTEYHKIPALLLEGTEGMIDLLQVTVDGHEVSGNFLLSGVVPTSILGLNFL